MRQPFDELVDRRALDLEGVRFAGYLAQYNVRWAVGDREDRILDRRRESTRNAWEEL